MSGTPLDNVQEPEPEAERYGGEVPGSDASMFIQWKGADVCMDFICPCGTNSHFDGFFAYRVRCRSCGLVFRLGTQVVATIVPDDPTLPALEPSDAFP